MYHIKNHIKRYCMLLILAMLPFCGVMSQKVIVYDGDKASKLAVPDFRANFAVLRKNRLLYNAYNDSIFSIHDHDQWVNFFRRRAVKNHQIYLGNQVALDNIFGYFRQDTIPASAYIDLYLAYAQDYREKNVDDPFLALEVCKLLDKFDEVAPDSLNFSNIINLWFTDSYAQLANLGHDSTFYHRGYRYLQKFVSEEAKRYPLYEKTYPQALWNLTKIPFLTSGSLSIQQHNQYFQQLKAWYQLHKDDTKIFTQKGWKTLNSFIRLHDENLLRNVYMADTTVMDPVLADSLMRGIVKRNLANPHLSDLSYSRTIMMQVKLGEITATQAVDLCLDRYRKVWKRIKNEKLDANELRDFVMPFYSFFYLNDISSRSFAHKRKIVKRMCADIEQAYMHRVDQQQNIAYVRYLNTLVTYPRITKYLTPAERIHFLNVLNVATQVTTYAHSVHVSMIAEVLMRGILEYQPELLVGALGDQQVTEILKNKRKYIDFIHDAAMYHDLGKNSIISVVNNDYRPLTDEEFAIIKRHPEYGLQYLELSPDLKKYHDTTLGHHKWYNGKGGYPDSFDNTKSPMRIMIDIVTLSDCMQAATERVGRNYKGEKTFDMVMEEFRRDAGTRYNPDLVGLIDEHSDLSGNLADLVIDGWVEIYYNIYRNYLQYRE